MLAKVYFYVSNLTIHQDTFSLIKYFGILIVIEDTSLESRQGIIDMDDVFFFVIGHISLHIFINTVLVSAASVLVPCICLRANHTKQTR